MALVLSGTLPDARAEIIVLESGEQVSGTIIQATRNAVVILRADGGFRQASLDDIREVRIDMPGGEPITGRLLGWSDGIYEVQSGKQVIRASEDRILSAEGTAQETQPIETAQTPGAGATEIQTAPVRGQATASEEPVTEVAAVHAGPPASVVSVVQAESVELGGGEPQARLKIAASAEPVAEDGVAAVFELKLSRPAEQLVAVVYVTVDGTAARGVDYEAQQGVLTLEPGSTSAELRTPVINDELPEGDEEFRLFLTADPNVAELSAEPIVAVIRDDD